MLDAVEDIGVAQHLTKDDILLENMGYKPELKRDFSPLQVFGVSFSIMSLVPSIASILGNSIAAGGAGMTWGWFVPCIGIMSIGISMSEFGSALPTSGGLYWWTYRFAPKRAKRVLSWFIGYADTFGLIAGVGSINYGFATQLLSCPAMAIDSYTPTNAETYGVFAGATILQAAVAFLPNKIMSQIQTFTIFLNSVAMGLIMIALPVGLKHKGGHLNDGSFVFGDTTNLLDWQYGWSWLLSWMAAIWTISSHDSAVHMSEEASNATVAVPFAIIMSIGLCWILGFAIMAILAAVINPDIGEVYNTNFGNYMAQIIFDCLNMRWAVGMMSLFAAIQWCMGLSSLVACSRQTWAFARDDALPFSRIIKKTVHSLPIYAIVFDVIVMLLIGLLILVNETAANAIFALSITSLQLSWVMPSFLRAVWFDPDAFVPGPFYMGHKLSRANCWLASIYSLFVVFCLTMMPTVKHVTADTMNYACVICGFVWISALLYYFIDGHKWYTGPKMTFDVDDTTAGALALDGKEPTSAGGVFTLAEKKLANSQSHTPSGSGSEI